MLKEFPSPQPFPKGRGDIRKNGSERTCKPGFVLGVNGHGGPSRQWVVISLRRQLLAIWCAQARCARVSRPRTRCLHYADLAIVRRTSAAYPEVLPDRTSPPRRFPRRYFLFGLAPGGVCLARLVAQSAGELLPHRFTLTDEQ